jgi:hypothetical protein
MKKISYLLLLPLLWYTGAYLEGSLALLKTLFLHHGPLTLYKKALLFSFDYRLSPTFLYDSLGLTMLLLPFLEPKARRLLFLAWPLFLFSSLIKQDALYGIANSLLLSISLQSLDLGFRIFSKEQKEISLFPYFFPTLYLVHHPYHLSPFIFASLFLLGAFLILLPLFYRRARQPLFFRALKPLAWTLPAFFSHFYPYLYLFSYLYEISEMPLYHLSTQVKAKINIYLSLYRRRSKIFR